MKKTILTTLVLGFLSFAAQAQYFGVKGGLNFSNFRTNDINDSKIRTGYHFGAFVNLPITDGLAFQPEVLYSTKGSTASYDKDFGILGHKKGDVSLKLDYIDVPLLAILKIGDVAEIQFGPYVGFLASSGYEATGDLATSNELDNNKFKSLDYGLAGGFAINLSVLQLGARYNMGFQKIEDSDTANLLFGDAKNSYLQLFAALRFGEY